MHREDQTQKKHTKMPFHTISSICHVVAIVAQRGLGIGEALTMCSNGKGFMIQNWRETQDSRIWLVSRLLLGQPPELGHLRILEPFLSYTYLDCRLVPVACTEVRTCFLVTDQSRQYAWQYLTRICPRHWFWTKPRGLNMGFLAQNGYVVHMLW